MHPDILGLVAQDHVRCLIDDADAARLAALARSAYGPRPGLRRRVGLRLIAAGERLAPEAPANVVRLFPTHGRRI
ncbi:MAG TPA: hypothetical protein VHN37_02290 [Actinomycetota bacterium]|nr:hypothetical protein [Actinomycetota bacterium]